MERFSTLPAHPIEVATSGPQIMTALVLGGKLQETLTHTQLNMDHGNPALLSLLGVVAEADFEQFSRRFSPAVGHDVASCFMSGSYLAYTALSMDRNDPLISQTAIPIPKVPSRFVEQIVRDSPEATLQGHEWHFAVHSNPSLRKILETVNGCHKRSSMHTQNAFFKGGGLVSHIINQYIAWLN